MVQVKPKNKTQQAVAEIQVSGVTAINPEEAQGLKEAAKGLNKVISNHSNMIKELKELFAQAEMLGVSPGTLSTVKSLTKVVARAIETNESLKQDLKSAKEQVDKVVEQPEIPRPKR